MNNSKEFNWTRKALLLIPQFEENMLPITYFVALNLFQQMVCAENVFSDRCLFNKMFEDLTDMLGHGEIYILLDGTAGIATQLCLDIFKSKQRKDYVQVISILKTTTILSKKRAQKTRGHVLIASLTNPKLTAIAANQVSFS